MNAASELYAELTKHFPPPWTLEYHPQAPHHERPCVSKIVASNGAYPLTLETFQGDGAVFYLDDEGAEALVKFVNAMQAMPECQECGGTRMTPGWVPSYGNLDPEAQPCSCQNAEVTRGELEARSQQGG